MTAAAGCLAPFTVAVRGASGDVAGMGLAVDRVHVVTPAHVVNRALGRDPQDPGSPAGAVLDASATSFGALNPAPGRPLKYTVAFWRPPGRDPRGDVAGLELAAGEAGPPAACQYAARPYPLGECSAYGDPGPASLRLSARLGYGYLGLAGDELAGQPGYDGAPVTGTGVTGSDTVIGILTTRNGRLLVATLETLAGSWPEVAGSAAGRSAPGGGTPPRRTA